MPYVDVTKFKPRKGPQCFQSCFQTLRKYVRTGAGSDDEQAPLTAGSSSSATGATVGTRTIMNKSPEEIYEENERETRAFILWFAVTSLTLFMGIGVVAYGYGPVEKWGLVKALYFSIATLTTVGQNPSLTPCSQAGRLFTTFFNLFGIFIDGIAVSELWAYIQEQHNQQMEAWNKAFAQALNDKVESTKLLQPLAMRAKRSPWYDFMVMVYWATVPLLIVNILGAGLIGLIEKWSFVDMVYYATLTCTTTGYGGLHPTKPLSYGLAIVYFPLAALAVGKALSTVASYYLKRAEEERRAWLLNQAYSWEGLFSMDDDSDGSIGEREFVVYFLSLWGMADEHVVTAILNRFQELDTNKSGKLTKEDFIKDQAERSKMGGWRGAALNV